MGYLIGTFIILAGFMTAATHPMLGVILVYCGCELRNGSLTNANN